MTIKDAISELKLDQRVLSDDLILTDRFLWNKIKNKTLFFIEQRNDKFNLNHNNNIYTSYCVEMEEVSSIDCCIDIPSCPLLKSIKPIPKIAESNKSSLIKGIYSIDKRKRFTMITLNDWIRLKQSKYKMKDNYVFLQDSYLYSEIGSAEGFIIEAFFEDIETLNKTCSACEADEFCEDVQSREWKISSDLQAIVLQEVNKELAAFYQSIPEIENTNKNTNIK